MNSSLSNMPSLRSPRSLIRMTLCFVLFSTAILSSSTRVSLWEFRLMSAYLMTSSSSDIMGILRRRVSIAIPLSLTSLSWSILELATWLHPHLAISSATSGIPLYPLITQAVSIPFSLHFSVIVLALFTSFFISIFKTGYLLPIFHLLNSFIYIHRFFALFFVPIDYITFLLHSELIQFGNGA